MENHASLLEERVVFGDRTVGLVRALTPWYWVALLIAEGHSIYRARYVLRNLVITQLKIRYHRSALGFFWTLLNPVMLLTVQAVVFSKLVPMPNYAVYLFSGFIPWQYFSTSLDNGSRSMISSEGLIRKIAAPKIIFPLADVIVCLINMVFAMAALFVMFQFLGARIYIQLILIPIGTLLLTLFTFGLVLICMSLTTFFRDFIHLIPVILSAWYFATPIMYKRQQLHDLAAGSFAERLIRFNPITYYLDFFHCAIFEGIWPPPHVWIISAACAILSLAVGYATFKKLEHEYIFRL